MLGSEPGLHGGRQVLSPPGHASPPNESVVKL